MRQLVITTNEAAWSPVAGLFSFRLEITPSKSDFTAASWLNEGVEKSPPLWGRDNEGGKASDWSRIQNPAFWLV